MVMMPTTVNKAVAADCIIIYYYTAMVVTVIYGVVVH